MYQFFFGFCFQSHHEIFTNALVPRGHRVRGARHSGGMVVEQGQDQRRPGQQQIVGDGLRRGGRGQPGEQVDRLVFGGQRRQQRRQPRGRRFGSRKRFGHAAQTYH